MELILIMAFPLGFAVFYTIRYLVRKGRLRKQQMKLVQAYNNMVFQHRALIDHCEVVGSRIVALDKKAKKLIVVDANEQNHQERCILLHQVHSTSVLEEISTDGTIDRILLELRPKKGGMLHTICFYDRRYDPLTSLRSLSRCAVHWKSRIDANRQPGSVNIEAEYVL